MRCHCTCGKATSPLHLNNPRKQVCQSVSDPQSPGHWDVMVATATVILTFVIFPQDLMCLLLGGPRAALSYRGEKEISA